MTMNRRLFYVAWGLAFLSSSASAQPVRYVWSKVPGAAYYQGRLKVHGDSSLIRTSSDWVLIPADSSLELRPYDERRNMIPGPVIQPRIDPKFKAAEDGPRFDSSKIADLVSPAESDAQPPSEYDLKSTSYLQFGVGLGRDDLQAKAGLYEYSGQSNIAPLEIAGAWVLPASDWSFGLVVTWHTFRVSNEVDPIEGGEATQKKESFTRLDAWVGSSLRVLRVESETGPQTLGLGLGIGAVQLPILKVVDGSTGQASLTSVRVNRIALQGVYEYWLSPGVNLGAKLRYAPLALDKTSTSEGYKLDLYAGYRIAAHQSMDFGLVTSSDEISQKSACDEGLACPAKTSATSKVTALQMSYDLSF